MQQRAEVGMLQVIDKYDKVVTETNDTRIIFLTPSRRSTGSCSDIYGFELFNSHSKLVFQ